MTGSNSKRIAVARELIALLGSILIGAACAAALMPTLVRRAPTDIARIPHLLDALGRPDSVPEVVVLGNSVAMCGVDAKRLSGALPGNPLSFNFASTGQTILESKLFVQALPESVHTVVLFLTHRELVSHNDLDASKYNAFFMGGFRLSDDNRSEIERGYPHLAPLFAEGEFAQRFRARWVVPRIIDGGIRQLMRADLALEHATKDLYFPQPYTKRISEAKLETSLERFLARDRELGLTIPQERLEILGTILADLSASGRRTLLVSPPVHPRIALARQQPLPETTIEVLRSLTSGDPIEWLDASSLLDSSEFIDDVHPTTEGAIRLTQLIADRLEAI